MNAPERPEDMTFEEFKAECRELIAYFAHIPAVREFEKLLNRGCSEIEAKRWLAAHLSDFPSPFKEGIAQAFTEYPFDPAAPQPATVETGLGAIEQYKPEVKSLPGTGQEIFFPRASYPNPVYDIEISGVLTFRFWHFTYWSGRRVDYIPITMDAFHEANKEGRFNSPHERLLVNGKPINWKPNAHSSYRQAEKLEAERGSHTYRFLIDDPGESVGIAFRTDRPGTHTHTATDDHLTVTVRALPSGTPTLKDRLRKSPAVVSPLVGQIAEENGIDLTKVKGTGDGGRITEADLQPYMPKKPETHDGYRERWVRNIERSSDDMAAALNAIHAGRQKQLDALQAMQLKPESDAYQQYLAEIDAWTANQIELFTKRRGGSHGNDATILG